MFENIENLKLLSITSGSSVSRKNAVRGRTGFVFRTAGECKYSFAEKESFLSTGQVVFVPKGTRYDFEVLSDDCRYMCIAIEADIKNPEPKIFSFEKLPDSKFFTTHLPSLWNLGNASDKYKCLAFVYSLLSYLAGIEQADYSSTCKFNIISPAIDYLKKHIFDSSLSTENLHRLCGVSDTYFRKIFIANFGTSPQKYIISKRLSQAMSEIDNGQVSGVSELALSVGYRDPLYFSRAFKQKYGSCPSEFLR